ncbi:MAG: prolipoprotein diacylglyceryl transferase [Candidatus Marinimicrobia bacterium]|nr:prolipoprotein diacylglyceryl transferase [Candidatus Neomarinimicrobiota bacterium]
MILAWVHDLKPYLFKIGNFEVRYYGLMYVIGFIFFYLWMKRVIRRGELKMTEKQLDSLFTGGILSVLIGGRLGYVLFYNLSWYIKHPLEIFMTWHGGMSFHGGAIAVILFVIWFSRKQGIDFWELIGECATIVPLGLFLGRLGNFINGELWGRPTNVPWAVIFPAAGNVPRHPSQLYEALMEGLFLFLFLLWLRKKGASGYVKFAAGLIFYGVGRFIVEFFREPDEQLGFIFFNWLTMGQLLCLVMIVGGITVLLVKKNPQTINNVSIESPPKKRHSIKK